VSEKEPDKDLVERGIENFGQKVKRLVNDVLRYREAKQKERREKEKLKIQYLDAQDKMRDRYEAQLKEERRLSDKLAEAIEKTIEIEKAELGNTGFNANFKYLEDVLTAHREARGK